jgi:uncharacterized protein YutE (UPF0331/DUF86 family)
MNDVVINKVQSIQRCVRRAREEFEADANNFASNFTVQDACMLNVVRACETAIDLANHVIRVRKLGIPASSADSFELLRAERIIDDALAETMRKMVSFRNTVVHQYTRIDLAIVVAVVKTGLDDVSKFADRVREYMDAALP